MVIGISLVCDGSDRCSSRRPAGAENDLTSAGAEDDGERDEPAKDETVAMCPGERVTVGGELEAGVTAEQGFESDPGFEPGQRRAEAVMDAVAEPEVRSVAAADVEDVG